MKRRFSVNASKNEDKKNSPTYLLHIIQYHLQSALDSIEEITPEAYEAIDGDSAVNDLDLLIRQVDAGLEKLVLSKKR